MLEIMVRIHTALERKTRMGIETKNLRVRNVTEGTVNTGAPAFQASEETVHVVHDSSSEEGGNAKRPHTSAAEHDPGEHHAFLWHLLMLYVS